MSPNPSGWDDQPDNQRCIKAALRRFQFRPMLPNRAASCFANASRRDAVGQRQEEIRGGLAGGWANKSGHPCWVWGMPTSYDVVFLGNLADIDTVEGNFTAENAAALVGLTIGSASNSLLSNFQTMTPGSVAFNSDGNNYYDMNDPTPETFRINGGPDQQFDGVAVYDATITYFDGTTATISAVVFQDTAGNAYLAPELANNADQAALEAGPLLSITLNSVIGNRFSGLRGDRESFDFVPCFTEGATIATATGPRAIETLRPGDLVKTRDNGLKPIRWIGAATCAVEGNLTPVRIPAGSLGRGLPARDLLVSPQHRMLFRSRVALRMFGRDEVLVPARKLLGLAGIAEAEDVREITYLHMLFDGHEVVFAEGAPSESLLVAEQSMKAIGAQGRAEIASFFPHLAKVPMRPARFIPAGRIARKLVWRHQKNAQPALG